MTTRLEDFGLLELDGAARILFAISETGWPDEFELSGVRLDVDWSSGLVFLINDFGQRLVLVDEKYHKVELLEEGEEYEGI